MKLLCKLCKHYSYNPREDSYSCIKNGIRNSEYGTFREGANCMHEEYLKDLFEPISKNEYSNKIEDLEKRASNYLSENQELKDKNEKLIQAIHALKN